jgi:hypothetical protein
MGFESREFDTAFNKAKCAHPTISCSLGETVMRKFIERWESNKQKASFAQVMFGELIRFTLNELNIAGKSKRQMYAALIGHYYKPHATYTQQRRTKCESPGPAKQSPPRAPVGILTETSGQLAWKL